MFVFRKIWRAFFSWNTRFEIRSFALLPSNSWLCFWQFPSSRNVLRKTSASWICRIGFYIVVKIIISDSSGILYLVGLYSTKDYLSQIFVFTLNLLYGFTVTTTTTTKTTIITFLKNKNTKKPLNNNKNDKNNFRQSRSIERSSTRVLIITFMYWLSFLRA